MMNIYIANLERYNAGELIGEWVELPAAPEEINETLVRIGVAVQKEYGIEVVYDYAIHDYETDYTFIQIGEYDNPYELNKLAGQIEAIATYDMDAFKTYMDLEGGDAAETIENRSWENRHFIHVGQTYNVERDAAHAVIDEVYCGLENMDENNLISHFDVEAFGRDLAYDFDSITEDMDEEDREELENMDDEEFGQWYIDSLGAVKELGRNTLETYFDYESYGRDLMMEYSYCEDTGYIMSDF